jgi:membrane associated rhomboid family serine protease
MSATKLPERTSGLPARNGQDVSKGQDQREGIVLLIGIVAVMWLVEVINTLDSNRLDNDGIIPRNVGHLWGILTSPFIHGSFQHLISNTIPFVFMGLIIALSGARRVVVVTLIVILIGGFGTWLIAPAHSVTFGASGVVFGYATYLLTRGLFDRSALELAIGVVVAVVWGAALLASLVPHYGVSWQAHVCGAIAGILAAWMLSPARRRRDGSASTPPADDPLRALTN